MPGKKINRKDAKGAKKTKYRSIYNHTNQPQKLTAETPRTLRKNYRSLNNKSVNE
jgi:hypothetical protein